MKAFSLRQSLLSQGVKTDEGLSRHLSFISTTLGVNPSLNLRTYRVDPNDLERAFMG